jgi:preprotein translocase subunit SecG
MMDFMKQDSIDKTANVEQSALQQSAAGASGVAGQDGFIATKAQANKIKQGTIALAVIFGIGLLCLWMMVKKTAPQAAAAASTTADTAIETAIAQVTGTKSEFFRSIEDVVGKFNEFSSKRQVKVQELQKNPFQHDRFARVSETVYRGNTETFAETKTVSDKSELQQQGSEMQLLSVIESPEGNSCMIDDKILKQGDVINGWKILSINKTSVELGAEGMKVTLRITSEG